jgi:hypothetical protein
MFLMAIFLAPTVFAGGEPATPSCPPSTTVVQKSAASRSVSPPARKTQVDFMPYAYGQYSNFGVHNPDMPDGQTGAGVGVLVNFMFPAHDNLYWVAQSWNSTNTVYGATFGVAGGVGTEQVGCTVGVEVTPGFMGFGWATTKSTGQCVFAILPKRIAVDPKVKIEPQLVLGLGMGYRCGDECQGVTNAVVGIGIEPRLNRNK